MLTAPLRSDPFSGTWVFVPGESHWLGAVPTNWVQDVACVDGRIRVSERSTSETGEQRSHAVEAAFDGQEYAVHGSSGVDTMAYTRTGPLHIEGVARKAGRVVFREIITLNPEADRLTQALSFLGSGGRTLCSTAIFRRSNRPMADMTDFQRESATRHSS